MPPVLESADPARSGAKQSFAEEVVVPDPPLDAQHVHTLFRHPHVQRRGRNYFREAIRFFHWPYHELQQELLEVGELHRTVSKITWKTLTRIDEAALSRIVRHHVESWATRLGSGSQEVNLVTQLRYPVVQAVYEFLFDTRLPPEDLEVFYQGARNFHDTMKGVTLRSKRQRLQLLARVRTQVERAVQAGSLHPDASPVASPELIARHYAAIFFATGVMQCVECITHTLTAVAQSPETRQRLQPPLGATAASADYQVIQENQYLDQVVKESLRLYPLFGRTAREVSESVEVGGVQIAKESTLILDFVKVHSAGWKDGDKFIAERWDKTSPHLAARELRDKHYMPFGTGPRSCPAKAFSLCFVKTAVLTILKNVHVLVPPSFVHTRRIPWGVPAVIERRQPGVTASAQSQVLLQQLERELPPNRDGGRLPGLSLSRTVAEMMNNRRSYGLLSLAFISPLVTAAQIGLFYLSRRFSARWSRSA